MDLLLCAFRSTFENMAVFNYNSTLSFVQWKFAFLSLGRPEYLQDGDVVAARFQVSLSKMICYLLFLAGLFVIPQLG